MSKTNAWLVEYAKAQIGRPYWYGACGEISTESLYKSLKKAYPSYYTASDFMSQLGVKVHDCSGLIKGAEWCDTVNGSPTYKASQDLSASGMYSKATKKGAISSFDKVNGRLVFRGSSPSAIHHVGVYCDDGYVYEAKGHAYGVVKTKYASSDWNYWAQHPDFTEGGSSGTSSTGSGTTGSTGGTTSGTKKDEPAESGPDASLSGTYTVTASSGLNIRYGIGEEVKVTIPKGTEVRCYGYYSTKSGVKWLYVQFVYNGYEYTGYASSEYLQKKSGSSSSSGSSGSSLPTYTVGNTYTTQVDHLAVRSSAEVKPDNKYAKSQLTDNGKANAHSDGCLKKGTTVTCKATKTVSGDVWMQIPSGWIAAYYNGNKYVK